MIVTINIDNCISQMPGSNYTFTSGANTGLNFSSNDDAEEPVESKSPMRMAGEVFSNQNDSSNSSVDKPKESTGSWWRNQYSDMVSSGSSNSDSDANSLENRNSTPPKDSASQSGWTDGGGITYKGETGTPTYDANKYKYYESDFGSGTGAEAYAKDMEGYNSMVAMNNGDGLAAGHLGLVSQMMHPDWGRSQKTGGGNPIVEQDYSQAPTGAAYGPGGKKEGIFGTSGSSAGQPKSKY